MKFTVVKKKKTSLCVCMNDSVTVKSKQLSVNTQVEPALKLI